MNKKIGFIGCGNMAQAMIGGITSNGLVPPESIMASDLNEKGLESAKEKYNIKVTRDNLEIAKWAEILFLSVKPNFYPAVIEEIKESVKNDIIIITIAAGKSIIGTENAFGRKIKVVRAMPNTPALVGEGMAALSPSNALSQEEKEEVAEIFRSFGKAEFVAEKLMDAVTAVSGSSPAYVYLFIEALADAAVAEGMPRPMAYTFAAQSVLGSAKMVLDTSMHPGELKDMVCSPGGTTIDAVAVLEEKGLRHAVISAAKKCAEKSKEMSK